MSVALATLSMYVVCYSFRAEKLYGECGGLNRMDMYTGEFAYCTSNAQAKS